MTLLSVLNRTKPAHIIAASIVFAAISVLVNLMSFSLDSLEILNAALVAIFSISITVFVCFIFVLSKKNNFIFSRTLLWICLAMIAWALGDILYLYLKCIQVDPFISPTDLFYIAASILSIVAVLTIPGSLPGSQRRNMVFIEISILVLSATVLFAIVLLQRGKPDLSFDLLTLLMVFVYPVLDIILIWIIIILYFAYPLKNFQKVLALFFIGATCLFFGDVYYLISSIYETLPGEYLFDLGYYAFYTFVLLAGFKGFKLIRLREPDARKKPTAFKSGNWIVFVPGIFLVVVIGLLVGFAFNQAFEMFHGVIALIAFIIVLFIVHQYMVIIDNIRLTKEMRKINAQLESKVEKRTAELSKAISELHDEMKEREKAEVHLARSNQDLALLNRDKDKLFSILAHDLRSPLGSMMNLSELLAENINDFNETELLEIISTLNKSASQTYQLFNDLLAWSAIQMGRGENDKEKFQLSEVISETMVMLISEAGRKQIEIHSGIDEALMAYADKFAIQTVVRNLISNAIKFTQNKGTITIMAEQNNDLVKISVSDNGVGISREKQKKIFRVDALSSTAGTEGEKGTGFGLLLCKDLVERNNGKIWLESDKGGSTFHFTLPSNQNMDSVTPKIPVTRVQYACDHSLRIGFTTMTGEINQTVLRSELSLIWSSSEYNPDYSVLVDLRLASFAIEKNDIPVILEIFSAMPGAKKNKKFAMLTATPQQVAFSTMFGQNIKNKYPFIIEIFSTHEAALNWLGV